MKLAADQFRLVQKVEGILLRRQDIRKSVRKVMRNYAIGRYEE